MLRVLMLAVGSLLIPFSIAVAQNGSMVDVGGRQLYIQCSGLRSSSSLTLVFIAGGDGTTKDWESVQPSTSKFAFSCSYDRAGLGRSTNPAGQQTADEIVKDLHALLKAARIPSPYLLIGHSLGGIYARRFATSFRGEVCAFVFLDSSHEEQAWRMQRISGGKINEAALPRRGMFTKPTEVLQWRTSLPLIVIERHRPFPRQAFTELTDAQFDATNQDWFAMQADLAGRSPIGKLIHADGSGHYIQRDRPDLVIAAIEDLIRQLQHRSSNPFER